MKTSAPLLTQRKRTLSEDVTERLPKPFCMVILPPDNP